MYEIGGIGPSHADTIVHVKAVDLHHLEHITEYAS